MMLSNNRKTHAQKPTSRQVDWKEDHHSKEKPESAVIFPNPSASPSVRPGAISVLPSGDLHYGTNEYADAEGAYDESLEVEQSTLRHVTPMPPPVVVSANLVDEQREREREQELQQAFDEINYYRNITTSAGCVQVVPPNDNNSEEPVVPLFKNRTKYILIGCICILVLVVVGAMVLALTIGKEDGTSNPTPYPTTRTQHPISQPGHQNPRPTAAPTTKPTLHPINTAPHAPIPTTYPSDMESYAPVPTTNPPKPTAYPATPRTRQPNSQPELQTPSHTAAPTSPNMHTTTTAPHAPKPTTYPSDMASFAPTRFPNF